MASQPAGTIARPSQEEIDALLQLNAEGRLADCLLRAEALLETYPQAPGLLALAAAAAKDTGQLGRALAFFDRLLVLQPGNAIALVDRGNCLSGLARFDEAVADYEQAIRLQPGNAAANNNCAALYYTQGRLALALERANAAIAAAPDWHEPHFCVKRVFPAPAFPDDASSKPTDPQPARTRAPAATAPAAARREGVRRCRLRCMRASLTAFPEDRVGSGLARLTCPWRWASSARAA